MSVARFVADQRTLHRVPHVVACLVLVLVLALVLSPSWFYKWVKAPVTARGCRRAELDANVRELFDASERSYALAAYPCGSGR